MGWRSYLGIGLLLAQLGAIAYARFVPSRYFCWAPHDSQSEYRIEAELYGKPLDEAAIERRYRISAKGVEARSIGLVLDVVRLYEEKTAPDERARVTVRYNVNGGAEQVWRWPSL